MANCTIADGGVLPNINPTLLPGKTGKSKEGGVEPSQEVWKFCINTDLWEYINACWFFITIVFVTLNPKKKNTCFSLNVTTSFLK